MGSPKCQSCGAETNEIYYYEDNKNGTGEVSWCGKCLLEHCEKYYPGSPNHLHLSAKYKGK